MPARGEELPAALPPFFNTCGELTPPGLRTVVPHAQGDERTEADDQDGGRYVDQCLLRRGTSVRVRPSAIVDGSPVRILLDHMPRKWSTLSPAESAQKILAVH